MTTWILVANASEAFIYGTENLRTDDLRLIKNFEHPQNREKGSDLVSDRSGHFVTSHGSRSAYESKAKPKEVEAEHFAIKLCKELKLNRERNDYDKLVIAVPAHFYGLIHKHLDRHVPEIVHIPKDYTKQQPKELLTHIREYIYG